MKTGIKPPCPGTLPGIKTMIRYHNSSVTLSSRSGSQRDFALESLPDCRPPTPTYPPRFHSGEWKRFPHTKPDYSSSLWRKWRTFEGDYAPECELRSWIAAGIPRFCANSANFRANRGIFLWVPDRLAEDAVFLRTRLWRRIPVDREIYREFALAGRV
jgi:hypothetical protein